MTPPLAPLLTRIGRPAPTSRSALVGLLAVAFALGLYQVLVLPIDRGLNWDEAVYVSQVARGEPAVFFDAHRSRGLVALIAPAAVFRPPMAVLRLWVTAVHLTLMVLAFLPWLRRFGWAAVLAAASFSAAWVTLFFTSEVYPNTSVALAAVGVTGWLVVSEPRGRSLVYASLWLSLMAFVRPIDAVLIGVGAAIGLLVAYRVRAVRPILTLTAAGIAGLLPWLIEGIVRFGLPTGNGLVSATQERTTGGERINQLPLYLRNLEGPMRCVKDCRAEFLADPMWFLPPPRSLLLLGVAGLAGSLALAWIVRHRAWELLTVPAIIGTLTTFYAWCGCAVNLRYVMPVYALVAVLAAIGVSAALRRLPDGALRRGGVALVAAGIALVAGWQSGLVRSEIDGTLQARSRAERLGEILADRADGRPCAAAVQYSYPQIQYSSPCVTVELWVGEQGWLQGPKGSASAHHDLAELADQGYVVFALDKSGLPASSPVRSWPSEDISNDAVGTYVLYTAPPGVSLRDVVPTGEG